MKKLLRFLMLAVLFLPFALQAQNTQTFDFEDNAIPADFTNDATHPWVVTSSSQGSGHSGTYCIMSGNAGVSSSTSTISATFTFVGDGTISFLAGIYGEGTSSVWDKCIFTIDGVQQFSYGALATWATYIFDVEPGTHTFEWTYSKDSSVNPTGDAFYLDDIVVDLGVVTSCAKPLAITPGTITGSSIDITWTPGGSETAWNVYIYENGNLLPGYPDNVTTAEYSFTGLNPLTSYTIGVRADCGDELSAERTISCTTACGTETFPWSENFNNWTTKSECWSFLSGALSSTPTPSTSAWTLNTSYGSYITIDGQALTMNLYSTNRYWAVTPPVEIMSDDAVLSVDVAVSAWSAAAPNYDDNDTLAFLISTDNGATFTILQVLDGTQLNTLGNTYTTIMSPVTGYNGQVVRFAIFGGSISGTSPYDNRIAIDNVTVGEAPSCMPVTNLVVSNITANGATLTWEGNADGYTIYNMADTTVDQYASDITAEIYALAPETQYTFGVTANCGSEESPFRTVTFTTLISCFVPTNLTAVLTPGDGTVATLTWHEVGTAQAWQICFNGDTTNLIDVTDTTYDFTDLTPETAYTAMVRAYCDVEDLSAWSNTITFTPTDSYTVTVNEGTSTNSYVPIYGFWVDNITQSQFIIPAANLTAMQFGVINKLTFYSSNSSVNWGAAAFNVYVTETSETTVSALADYSSMTQVYAGTLSIVDNKMEVTFTSPFLYMGGNLMIGFLQTSTGTYSSCNWYGVEATGASMGGYGSSISQRDFLPKTTIGFTPGEEPDCFPVSGLTVSGITGNNATLSWTGSSADSYSIIDMSDNTVLATVSEETYEFTDLEPMTHYSIGVVANCGGSQSIVMSVMFNTECGAVTLPYTETFEANSGSITCWTSEGAGEWTIGTGDYSTTTGAYQGSQNALITHNTTGNVTKFVSPVLDGVEDGVILMFAYVMRQWSSDIDELRVYTRSAADSAWQQVAEYTAAAESWTPVNLAIPGTVYQVAFEYTDNYGYGVGIDNVVLIPMGSDYCYPVSNIAVSGVTSSSVSLTWQEEGDAISWNVAYGPAGFSVGGSDASIESVTETTATFDDLTAGQTYDFYVQADCGSGVSEWTGPVQATPGSFTFGVTGSASVTACGLVIYDDGGSNGNYSNNCHYTLTVYPSDPDSVVSVSGTFAGEGTADYLSVYDGTSTSGTLLQKITSGTSGTVINFGPLTSESGPITLLFHSDVSIVYSGFEAIVSCVEAPECRTPYGLTASNVSANEATISWIADEDATIELYYKKHNETSWITVTASDFTTTDSYLMTNLDPATTYDVYLANLCTEDTLESSMITFTTLCAAVTAPYSENFTGFNTLVSPCWERYSGLASSVFAGGSLTSTTSGWAFSSSNVFPLGHPKINIYGSSCNYWLVSPSIDLSQLTNPTLMFSLALTDYDNADPIEDPTSQADDQFMVVISTDNGASWSAANATVWNNTSTGDYPYNSISNTGEDITISLSQYAGQTIRIAFYGESTASGGDNDLHIANLVVDEAPSCPRPTQLTATDATENSITVTWTAGGDETSWDIIYGAPGFDLSTEGTTLSSVTTNPYVITGLSNTSTYEIYVRANCGSGEYSLWSNGLMASTTMTATALPYQTDFSTDQSWLMNNGAAPNYWMMGTPTGETTSALFVTNDGASAGYNIGSASVAMAEKLFVMPAGDSVHVEFDVQVGGEGTSYPYDYLKVFLAPATVEFTAGATSSNTQSSYTYSENAFDFSDYISQTGESSYPYKLSLTQGNTLHINMNVVNPDPNGSAKIVFLWRNDTSSGTQPGAVVRNFSISETGSGPGPVITDPTVATTAATAIEQTTATLNATITNPDNVTITAKGFEWKATTGGTYTQIAGTGTGNNFSANLTGLTANTGYTYRAFITFNGTTVTGNEMTFTTLEQGVEPCDAPTGLTAGDITGESIAISWNAVANAEGYNIQYSPQGGTISSASSTTNSYTITGLTQNTTYQIQVQANCGDGNLSGWSQPISVTTTGIESHLANSIALYPNPAKEYVDVRIDGDINVTGMEVFDVYGKLINTINVVDNPTRINVSGLANGMYFVRVTTDAGAVTKTFVKK